MRNRKKQSGLIDNVEFGFKNDDLAPLEWEYTLVDLHCNIEFSVIFLPLFLFYSDLLVLIHVYGVRVGFFQVNDALAIIHNRRLVKVSHFYI